MSFGSRLKEKREELGLKQSELGEMLGITGSAIGNYENGISSPKADVLYKVFDVLKCDANYLFQDEMAALHEANATPDEMEHLVKKYRLLAPNWKKAVDGVLDIGYEEQRDSRRASVMQESLKRMEAAEEIAPEVVFICPGFTSPMSAGTGQEAGGEYPENYRLIKEPPRGTSYIAPVSGISMEPTYHDGEKLFIHACTEIRPGQIGVFLMDGQQWVKELGEGVLLSHNPEYEPRAMTDGIQCQGLVLGVCDDSYFE